MNARGRHGDEEASVLLVAEQTTWKLSVGMMKRHVSHLQFHSDDPDVMVWRDAL